MIRYLDQATIVRMLALIIFQNGFILFGYLPDVRRRRSVSRLGDSPFVRTTIYSFSFGFVGAWNKCAT